MNDSLYGFLYSISRRKNACCFLRQTWSWTLTGDERQAAWHRGHTDNPKKHLGSNCRLQNKCWQQRKEGLPDIPLRDENAYLRMNYCNCCWWLANLDYVIFLHNCNENKTYVRSSAAERFMTANYDMVIINKFWLRNPKSIIFLTLFGYLDE